RPQSRQTHSKLSARTRCGPVQAAVALPHSAQLSVRPSPFSAIVSSAIIFFPLVRPASREGPALPGLPPDYPIGRRGGASPPVRGKNPARKPLGGAVPPLP